MRSYEDPESDDYNPAAVEADRALGAAAADMVRRRNFPDFSELAFTGVGLYEPHLIYRKGDDFLVIETEVVDGPEDDIGKWGRELANGQVAQRGTREYLLAGVQDLDDRTRSVGKLTTDFQAALAQSRLRYCLVSVIVGAKDGKQEVDSLRLREFDL